MIEVIFFERGLQQGDVYITPEQFDGYSEALATGGVYDDSTVSKIVDCDGWYEIWIDYV